MLMKYFEREIELERYIYILAVSLIIGKPRLTTDGIFLLFGSRPYIEKHMKQHKRTTDKLGSTEYEDSEAVE